MANKILINRDELDEIIFDLDESIKSICGTKMGFGIIIFGQTERGFFTNVDKSVVLDKLKELIEVIDENNEPVEEVKH